MSGKNVLWFFLDAELLHLYTLRVFSSFSNTLLALRPPPLHLLSPRDTILITKFYCLQQHVEQWPEKWRPVKNIDCTYKHFIAFMIHWLFISRAENIVFLLLCSFITGNTRFNNFQKIKHQKVSQINFTTSKGFQQQRILFQLLRSFARSWASISASNDRNYQKLHGLLASQAADRGQPFSLKWTRRYSDPVCSTSLYYIADLDNNFLIYISPPFVWPRKQQY